ncbi:bifunctional homocysteine S-methyltransferase/methylenetetrahydrofolate reductase [Chryseomicrobium excrementi]|uniref:Bifunctional homocysteine S-methyltransferase/methylenetetrahydrofolate reductase n=1 Tax=Chryseomicrobium excrementi TaxID=2041346 RepID=A0A2M9EZM7_9BACL|nr:bifunctional homocysteine S-methyltransferase/methylenetetrahydrofolate reductase [Chryseomicrobium excrementi]PJK16664.1 bifunctional homocysteine S-methyltransferase/methylenetetrahydrofolate reductase [Chryseomicrobium excrementi]
MKRPFLEQLRDRVLVADGAMGTLLYSYGVDHCNEELNFSHPEDVLRVHQQYIEAGAEVIQTNTYAANYVKLARYGLQEQVKAINTAAVRLAKQAAGEEVYVLGTIGGLRGIKQDIPLDEIKRSFREQLYIFLMEGVDALLLETYYDFEELETVVQIAKQECELPIIAELSMHEVGVLQNGWTLAEGLSRLEGLGADVVGINCRMGPFHMLTALKNVPIPQKALLSVYPNASLPQLEEGRYTYAEEFSYFGDIAEELRQQGVHLIGGCCGTTPGHIQAVSERLKDRTPITEKQAIPLKAVRKVVEPSEESPLLQKVRNETTILVELDPPKHLNTDRFYEGIEALHKAGADALTLADNPLASPRVGNDAVAAIIKQRYGANPLVHLTCRDRNLIGLQSHLMGLHELGVQDLLAITGDPAKIGDFPGAASVYDLSSLELIELIKQNNKGYSFSGKSLERPTQFSVGAAFNPNYRHMDASVKRLEKKVAAGADYFITQPVFGIEQLHALAEASKQVDRPFFVGIMPLLSSRNAEFLHHEVPGIRLPDDTRERMRLAGEDPKRALEEGMAITKELVAEAVKLFNGIYLITPFLRYELSLELIHYITSRKQEESHDQLYI